MRIAIILILVFVLIIPFLVSVDFTGVMWWAVEKQREFQNQMASAIRALRMGEPGAVAALFAAAGAYGFVHAVGPGHGKYLIGGVGFGTSIPIIRLLGVSVVSSIMQAVWAIVLVYGSFLIFEASARQVTALAENYLAPVSYLAIASVGLIQVWRGVQSLLHHADHDHPSEHLHSHEKCGCNAHGPSPAEIANLGSLREALALVLSIAIRPCTGAIFLLVIAWQMDFKIAGAMAVIIMGMGTACLTSLVAISSVAARGIAFVSAGQASAIPFMFSTLQVLAGALIVWVSIMFFRIAI